MLITSRFERHIIAEVIEAYLKNGKSHRQIQREILNLPAPSRGGGFVAMEILHHYDITGEMKNVLNRVSINELKKHKNLNFKKAINIYEELNVARKEVDFFLKNQKINNDNNPTEIHSVIKKRVYQNKIRDITLSNYNNTCSLCDINKPDLLICSHIKPWAIDKKERLNPKNTICLCVLHDKMFDKGYFSLDTNYNIIYGKKADNQIKDLLKGITFKTPNISPPDKVFLKFHFKEICS